MRAIIIPYYPERIPYFVQDSFTEASNVSLPSHTGEIGGWVAHPHVNYGGGPLSLDAATGRVYGTGTNASYSTITPSNANYYVEADFYLHSAIAQSNGICARMDTVNDTMYLARLVDGSFWQLRRAINGGFVTLGSTSTNQIPTSGNSKRGKLVVNGDQISFYVEGVLEIGPITNNEISAAGRVGIRNNGIASSSTGTHIDNLVAGQI
jgi:hypothetical protein